MDHFVNLDQLRRIDAQIDAISEVRQMAQGTHREHSLDASSPGAFADYLGVVVGALEAVYAEILGQELP